MTPQNVYAVDFDPRWPAAELAAEVLQGPFGAAQAHNAGLLGWLAAEFPADVLQGPFGAAQAHNAGLLGWLAAGGRI